MFQNTTTPDRSADEATVIQVDPLRRVCKVKTMRGQKLDHVKWVEEIGGSSRAGDRKNPSMGDQVLIEYRLGYPVITGFLPRPQTSDNSFPVNINSNATVVDTGDYSAMGTLVSADANRPQDILIGDRILTSEGGGLVGLLKAGSVVIKSSALAQIFLSKLDDVVKIISRNWEHYTDVSSDIVKNFRGRVYRYIGYSNSYAEAKQENYRYHQYYGDVAAAEAVKTNYLSPGTVPATNNLIFKEQVTNGGEKMRRTINTSGEEELYVTTGGTFTRQATTGSQITISYGDHNTITVNDPVIQLQRTDGAVVTMTASGITMQYAGGEVKMDAGGVYNSFGGHFANVTGSGVQLG